MIDKDPIWMKKTIKSKIQAKNTLSTKWKISECNQNERFESVFVFLENLITELHELISSTKTLHYENLAKKLNNPLLQENSYWSIKDIL